MDGKLGGSGKLLLPTSGSVKDSLQTAPLPGGFGICEDSRRWTDLAGMVSGLNVVEERQVILDASGTVMCTGIALLKCKILMQWSLGVGLRLSFSHQLSGNADAVGARITLRKQDLDCWFPSPGCTSNYLERL